MIDVHEWLHSIGLGQYADSFADNEVDWSVSPHLDHAVLKDIGLKAPGHCVRILKAGETLHPLAARGLNEPQESSPADSAPPLTPGGAEHRQLTVMFCDLVGSLEMSEGIEVELYWDLLMQFGTSLSLRLSNMGVHCASSR